MRTFACGDQVVTANTIDEGVAVVVHLDRLEAARKLRNKLRENRHGHNFGYNRVCRCGLSERDYYMKQGDSEVCRCKVES